MKSLPNAVGAARGWLGDRVRARPALAAALRQGFDWAYGKAVDGMPGIDGAADLATRYAARHATADAAVADLILWQSGMAGAAGFVTGCGGLVALPAALPANLASALYIQARLVAAIAHLRGHDVKSAEVRALALACLGGSKAAGTLKDAGVRLGTRMTRDTIGWVSPVVLKRARHASHVSMACGVGVQGAARFGTFVPVVGGVLAGGFDAAVTRLIGKTADRVFAAAPSVTPAI
jgi:hypothetical protein